MEISTELEGLAGALCAAQAEFAAVPKDAENPFFRSKYATLATVVKTTAPVLTKHGLSIAQTIGYRDGVDTLTTVLFHTSGQHISDTMRLHLTKEDPQSQGSATSYARRYAYQSILGVVCEEDDDGEAASPKPVNTKPWSEIKKKSPERPPEARVSAADAKRELILDAEEKGHDGFNAKLQAKQAWGDRGTEAIMRSELLLLMMSIEKVAK